MTTSVLVHGPQGCGKTLHAPAIAKALGLKRIYELDDVSNDRRALNDIKRGDCLVLSHFVPPMHMRHLKVMGFSEAMKKVSA